MYIYMSLDVAFLVAHSVFLIIYHAFKIQSEMTKRCKEAECMLNIFIRHPSCCSRLIPMVVISDDTGNNSYNNLKSIPIWKIYISHTFPQALGVSRRTFDSNNLCHFLVQLLRYTGDVGEMNAGLLFNPT
jgi:hypothetical protein